MMADFKQAFEKMINNEGGYRLHTVRGDRGGMTYSGIARRFHPGWPGWTLLDAATEDAPQLTGMVRGFYRDNFWDPLHGDDVSSQRIAETLFDFAVNAGIRVAVKLAQVAIGTTPDGIIGPVTIKGLNSAVPEKFVPLYALAKITRYAAICNKNRTQSKFLLGWINRTLKGVA